eukprot:Rmarinus@m.20104
MTTCNIDVWKRCVENAGLQNRTSGTYAYYLSSASSVIDGAELKLIGIDARRFDKALLSLCNVSHDELSERVERVLRAFSARNREFGYWQGMNFVVATLLSCVYEEDLAFWLFCTFVEKMLPAKYYSIQHPMLLGFHSTCAACLELIRSECGALSTLLESDDLDAFVPLLLVRWLMPLFVDVLSVEASVALFEEACLATHGDMGLVLCRVALGILREAEGRAVDAYVETQSVVDVIQQLSNFAKGCDEEMVRTMVRDEWITLDRLDALRDKISAQLRSQQQLRELKGVTHFDESHLKQLESEFRSLASTEVEEGDVTAAAVDRKMFNVVVSRVCPFWPSSDVDRLFRAADTQCRGVVTFQNLMLVLSTLVKGTVEERLRLCFNLFDEDQNGYLDFGEMFCLSNILYQMSERLRQDVFGESYYTDPPASATLSRARSSSLPSIFKNTMRRLSSPWFQDAQQSLISSEACSTDEATFEEIRPRAVSSSATPFKSTTTVTNTSSSSRSGVCARRSLPGPAADPREESAARFTKKLLRMAGQATDGTGGVGLTYDGWREGALADPDILLCFEIEVASSRPASISQPDGFDPADLPQHEPISLLRASVSSSPRLRSLSPSSSIHSHSGSTLSPTSVRGASGHIDFDGLELPPSGSRRPHKSALCPCFGT